MHLSVCITNVAAGKGEDNLNYLIEWINLLSLLGSSSKYLSMIQLNSVFN